MAGIAALSTTFNLPNYPGELFGLSPEETRFLSMAGGLTGGGSYTESVIFGWSTYDLRAPSNRQRLEGADAPTPEARVRGYEFNVLEIHQEKVSTSYTKQNARGQFADLGSTQHIEGLEGANAVRDEHGWQTEQTIKQVARDVNYSFINGTYALPADNSTARATRGILAAITTNVHAKATNSTAVTGEDADDLIDDTATSFANGDQVMFTALTGGSNLDTDTVYFVINKLTDSFQLALTPSGSAVSFGSDITAATIVKLTEPTVDYVGDLMQDIWDNGGIQEGDTRVLFSNSGLRRWLSYLFIEQMGYQETSRNIGGVAVTAIETDFGMLNLALERMLPRDTILIASMEWIEPVWMLDPEKGFLFMEPLAKTGASHNDQLYGEVGLAYGVEKHHGKITGLEGKFVRPAA